MADGIPTVEYRRVDPEAGPPSGEESACVGDGSALRDLESHLLQRKTAPALAGAVVADRG